jgi:NADH-quinone oxidoreductase subunit E
MVNWEFMDNQTPESAVELVDDLRSGKDVYSTRGPKVCTWREAERVLAGFNDGLADEGPAAGPASLVGLEIARERGWSSPGPGGAEADEDDFELVEDEIETEIAESEVDLKHEDNPEDEGGDGK